MKFGVVTIGRNEGDRLKACLASLSGAIAIVYVDSGSTDDSIKIARWAGADIVNLDLAVPFTAARARNAGFHRLLQLDSTISYVQFVDGDCELVPTWPSQAISYLDQNADVGAVSGRRHERFPERSIYNWLCDLEWNTPIGAAASFGGDVMIRVEALEAVGGYRDDMIAGEEPELCVRMRAEGWRIWRLDRSMTVHDAAMTRFTQWWRRSLRAGYAYALGASIHGAPPENFKVRESRRAWIWGVWLPLASLLALFWYHPLGLILITMYPLQMLRLTIRRHGPVADRLTVAFFQTLARFPEGIGQVQFLRDRILRRRPHLIEYK